MNSQETFKALILFKPKHVWSFQWKIGSHLVCCDSDTELSTLCFQTVQKGWASNHSDASLRFRRFLAPSLHIHQTPGCLLELLAIFLCSVICALPKSYLFCCFVHFLSAFTCSVVTILQRSIWLQKLLQFLGAWHELAQCERAWCNHHSVCLYVCMYV